MLDKSINGFYPLPKKEYSPERAQLLLSLVNSRLDSITMNRIYESTTFDQSYLFTVNLRKANLIGADLIVANLSEADLVFANLSEANLREADLSDADLKNVKNLDASQLQDAKSLYKVKNLDLEIKKELEEKKPCLFTEEGCE